MSSPSNARPSGLIQTPQKSTKKYRKLITFLLSCCLLLAVFSACLLGALVLVGKHYIYNNNGTEFIKPSRFTTSPNHKIFRLPKDVRPIHYDITIKADLEKGTFNGRVNITINVTNIRHDVFINSKELTIHGVNLTRANNSDNVEKVEVNENKIDEALQIIPKKALNPGEYYLIINYSGSMGRNKSKLVGLYQSTYENINETLRYMATSKFEPTYARQAYPCFDEPNMKATFTVHLRKPIEDGYIALSNMPEEYTTDEDDGENVMVHFSKSVAMSTYLTCFIVSDFSYTEDTIGTGDDAILFKVYATPEQVEKTDYAKSVGKGVIEYFIEYFGIPFPLPKLDMAAIPDFVSGAMEHWGLVTFRETALLYSTETSSSANQQRIATVVSHELAHSWFGNLVTMNWWDDLWLNEGFASYIEYKGVNHMHSDWDMLDQFLIEDLHPVLILDSTLGSHPIVQTVLTPDQITEIFDTISYNKGAAILRMLEGAVGDDTFKTGVTKYLNEHLYGNAVTQDLWDALQETTDMGLDISEFMNTWTMQMGYPVINVADSGDNYILTQSRYLTNPDAEDNTETPYNYKWTIPVTYITSESSTPTYVWFSYKYESVTVPKPTGSWIKFNHDQVGYYRVNYEETEWNNLINNIKDLTVSDRAHLIEETFRLAESKHISYDVPLNLIKNLAEELDYVPWSVLSTVLQELDVYLSNSDVYTEFKSFVIDSLSNAYDFLTWAESDDLHLKKRARVTVLNLACMMGHEDCLTQAKTLFTTWLTDGSPLSQDLRTIVYNYGMSSGTANEWEQLFNLFEGETDATEKLKLMQGLTYVKEPSLLLRLIEIANTDGVVRSQDYFTLLQYIAANPVGAPIVWDYVRENWESLVARFTLNDRYLGRLIPSITKRFTTVTKLEEMQAFFAKYPDAGAGAASRVQALETVENNIQWVANNKQIVEDWITNLGDS